MNIAALDKNLKIDSKIDKPDILWLDATNSVFNIYGAAGVSPFVRVPVEVGGAVSEGVSALNYHTAGIRIRFRTDSPYIAIHAEWEG